MTYPTDTFRFAALQMHIRPTRQENLDHAEEMIGRAARDGAQIVCLPELFCGPYFCQKEDHGFFDLAEPLDGPTCTKLSALAKSLGIVIVGSIFERRSAGMYHNTAVVFDADGRLAGMYRKMHIPDDPLFYEKFYFTPGDLGFQAIRTKFARIGTLVCWDQWFPEAARATALLGAEILCYPTAIGWHPSEKAEFGTKQREAWMAVQRGHAVANGLYVAGINRIGLERIEGAPGDGIEFWGHSFIAGPSGEWLAQGSDNREEILLTTCSRKTLEDVRRHWPFLRDRRIDAYGALLHHPAIIT